ncbi:uncharacterized protein M421DRAFT_240703 [Didymella exigua CBS 183.55]|uniref:Uncharacterized protein n=1 Tax=Didymella exigua CBS 183.55 TaxID=1150837 RepID=A0A6A5RDK8_9PLEO|nr:uncharacterized protein M421DRAFT_240703 [Didymella exigua CBS 183.55]KAF1925400.1 hypothetical protein M421DRAFT_240703 [Didymella exigua CBS 183.55]
MLSLHLIALALAFLTTSITALPAPGFSLIPRVATERWSIPTMELHMMTQHSGLPGGGEWPESSKYPSTISFAIHMPGQIAHCHTEFANGTLPDDLASCSSEGSRMRFRMEQYMGSGPRRKELAFVLKVSRVDNTSAGQIIFQGEVAITANDPKDASSYLTCLLGPPFDGLRCELMGLMSNRKDLVIEAHSSKVNTIALLTAS